jgi:hypothetical protein
VLIAIGASPNRPDDGFSKVTDDSLCAVSIKPLGSFVAIADFGSRRAEFPLRLKGLENAKLRRRTLSFG